ncbi:putative bifunctional diguanylate cyclase/phosphodiesterase [Pengzhenrongella sicca]|uniref:EAL domain-containing protein n=1 Tax=Pengzhenrongella sicca TaxID=2819238 RepID=A0A8A4ZK08_9MICO|nr:EAL domain-containing protein [Pengzhenrongella sicca]QTE30846.1 EAL domain-containing protein [Pengzhenrongella sicca]
MSADHQEPTGPRGRALSVALVLVLLVLGGLVVGSSQMTARAAREVAVATRLSDAYTHAVSAAAAEQSRAHTYRLEPVPAARASFDAAADDLVRALAAAARAGGAPDRESAAQILFVHEDYLAAADRLFAAIEAGDGALALAIETDEAGPLSAQLGAMVGAAATVHLRNAQVQLRQLERSEGVDGALTPIVFLVGLVLAAALAYVSRGDRRALEVARERALHASRHDLLTGLPNRAFLAERCAADLLAARVTGLPVALLLIDIDRFKEINDTFGHHYGDQLLAQVGPRLRAALRDGETIARLGGDEFAVLLPAVGDLAAAVFVAGRLRSALEQPFQVDGVALDVEASVGVVLSGLHGDDATTLLRRVDIAMYVAKTQSLGVFVYTCAVDGHSPQRLALFGDLRRALDLGELELHYQPQISTATGALVGVEALVRWQHPARGLVFPDEFIPMAEHTGVIGPLTRYVLGAALAQARRWLDARQALLVSVNLSARNLLDESLPGQVADLLAVHGVPAELLQLEVTESAIMIEPARAQRVLTALAGLGVRLSIDDFGAGYTSLSQLKTLPVSELKIDRSFVLTMATSPSDALIVRSIVDLGHNLGLSIVAEGVETAAALATLTGFGCDTAQGYLLSRPVPAGAFDLWRAERQLLPTQASPASARSRLGRPARLG